MRLLPVLILIIAVLSISEAIKCYVGEAATAKEQTCPAISLSCVSEGNKEKMRKMCGGNICSDDCISVKAGNIDMTRCCCTGDLCNPAVSPTLLLSLAAVAAMFAARM